MISNFDINLFTPLFSPHALTHTHVHLFYFSFFFFFLTRSRIAWGGVSAVVYAAVAEAHRRHPPRTLVLVGVSWEQPHHQPDVVFVVFAVAGKALHLHLPPLRKLVCVF